MSAYPSPRSARSRTNRLVRGALAIAIAGALSVAGIVLSPQTQVADADPAPAQPTTSITATGAFTGTVPQGVCSVTATVLGAAGGSAGVAAVVNGNGAGAQVTVTYPVVPGMTYSGTVGGGGGEPSGASSSSTAGPGGSNGGGVGGTSGPISNIRHHGAGGGGYSELLLGGTTAVVAGGGGGSGGGHSSTAAGAGGNAGLPSTTGVTAGSNGNNGRDVDSSTTVQGGRGGQTAAPGAGGTNSDSSGSPGTNGLAGSGRNGGAGGADPNPDAAGGGGGGYTGGGGGASTNGYNTQDGVRDVAGAGGGGGSSYVAPSVPMGSGTSTPASISSIAGEKIASGAGNGANGAVSLVWNSCSYDLAVDKSVSSAGVASNTPVTWTVAVTNLGPAAMSQGDTVTITDTLPGTGAKTIASIAVSGGSNAVLGRGAVTCNAGVGAAMPASLECSRPYQIGAGAANGVRGLDVGETLTVTYTQTITAAAGTTLTNTATVVDRFPGDSNDSDTASTTVLAAPGAVNDTRTGIAIGTVVTVPVTDNDTGTLAANSVVLWNPATSSVIPSPYLVSGQGTWTVANNEVTFTPSAGYKGDPTPVTYRVSATNGLTSTATVTITYVPVAVDDALNGLALGTTATVHPLANDNGDFVGSSLRLIDPSTSNAVTGPVVVAGQGTWAISGTDVLFTPQAGYKGDPTPISYRITDSTGDQVSASITVTYVPTATNDSNTGNAIGATVNTNVLQNDDGTWNTSTLVFDSNSGTTLVVAGQGTWTVQAGGVIRFVPQAGYQGDPTPVTYRVTDVTGDAVTAQLTVGYVPAASDDESLGNALGTTVTVTVLGNDVGDFVTGTVRIMDGLNPVTTLAVPGQGTWSVVGDEIRFVPEAGYLGDPTPVHYRVADSTGDFATATVTVTYVPAATDDSRTGLAIGATATVPVLANDDGDWVPGSLRLVHPTSGTFVTTVAVAGQGTWSVSGTDVVFVPEGGFLTDPDPIDYRITDSTADTVQATVTLNYVPAAADDSDLNNTIGDRVDVSVLDNDTGALVQGSLEFTAGGTTLVVAGQGTWSIAAGIVSFDPLPAFLGDPTPVSYRITDVTGDSATALVTVTYVPAAADDSDLDNVLGSDVNVDVLANDTGDFTPGTVRLLDGAVPVTTLVVAGEGTWTVEADDTITFSPQPGFLVDPGTVDYRVTDSTGDIVSATITVTYLPQAVDNTSAGNAAGTTVNVNVIGNDTGQFDLASLRVLDGGVPVLDFTVAGQGRWLANSDGSITFFPEAGYFADPDPIDYEVTDVTGDSVRAQLTITYVPVAAVNQSNGNVLGATVVIDPLANDTGTFDATSLRLLDGITPVTSLVVAGEGTWDVNTATGEVTFTPDAGYVGNPGPVTYQVTDVTGDVVQSTITITYLPVAIDDEDLGNQEGDPVSVSVLPNDLGQFDTTSARLVSGGAPMMTMVAPGEGTWRMNAAAAVATFTPDAGFTGDPTPVPYRVMDVNGNAATANITITYLRAGGLALTGVPVEGTLAAALGAIGLGLMAVAIGRTRRVTARHRA